MEDDITSVALAMRHVAEVVGASSLGDSKSEGEEDEVMAIAATSADSSSSLSSSPEMYYSLVTNTILEGDFLLGKFFLK